LNWKPPKIPRVTKTRRSLGGNKTLQTQERFHPMGAPTHPVVRCKRSPSAEKIGPLRYTAATLLTLPKLCLFPQNPPKYLLHRGVWLAGGGGGCMVAEVFL
jgi:hypothetical protein